MPFLKYVRLLFVGGDFLLISSQILVDQHPEIRFPVIPFLAERLAGDSDQLVQGFTEPIELPPHGLVLGRASVFRKQRPAPRSFLRLVGNLAVEHHFEVIETRARIGGDRDDLHFWETAFEHL